MSMHSHTIGLEIWLFEYFSSSRCVCGHCRALKALARQQICRLAFSFGVNQSDKFLFTWTASCEFGTYRICEAKVQTSLRMRAVSPEPSLLAHTSSESRGTFKQKARFLAPLNGWACAFKICHDGMLEGTNSLDRAHMTLYCGSSEVEG